MRLTPASSNMGSTPGPHTDHDLIALAEPALVHRRDLHPALRLHAYRHSHLGDSPLWTQHRDEVAAVGPLADRRGRHRQDRIGPARSVDDYAVGAISGDRLARAVQHD